MFSFHVPPRTPQGSARGQEDDKHEQDPDLPKPPQPPPRLGTSTLHRPVPGGRLALPVGPPNPPNTSPRDSDQPVLHGRRTYNRTSSPIRSQGERYGGLTSLTTISQLIPHPPSSSIGALPSSITTSTSSLDLLNDPGRERSSSLVSSLDSALISPSEHTSALEAKDLPPFSSSILEDDELDDDLAPPTLSCFKDGSLLSVDEVMLDEVAVALLTKTERQGVVDEETITEIQKDIAAGLEVIKKAPTKDDLEREREERQKTVMVLIAEEVSSPHEDKGKEGVTVIDKSKEGKHRNNEEEEEEKEELKRTRLGDITESDDENDKLLTMPASVSEQNEKAKKYNYLNDVEEKISRQRRRLTRWGERLVKMKAKGPGLRAEGQSIDSSPMGGSGSERNAFNVLSILGIVGNETQTMRKKVDLVGQSEEKTVNTSKTITVHGDDDDSDEGGESDESSDWKDTGISNDATGLVPEGKVISSSSSQHTVDGVVALPSTMVTLNASDLLQSGMTEVDVAKRLWKHVVTSAEAEREAKEHEAKMEEEEMRRMEAEREELERLVKKFGPLGEEGDEMATRRDREEEKGMSLETAKDTSNVATEDRSVDEDKATNEGKGHEGLLEEIDVSLYDYIIPRRRSLPTNKEQDRLPLSPSSAKLADHTSLPQLSSSSSSSLPSSRLQALPSVIPLSSEDIASGPNPSESSQPMSFASLTKSILTKVKKEMMDEGGSKGGSVASKQLECLRREREELEKELARQRLERVKKYERSDTKTQEEEERVERERLRQEHMRREALRETTMMQRASLHYERGCLRRQGLSPWKAFVVRLKELRHQADTMAMRIRMEASLGQWRHCLITQAKEAQRKEMDMCRTADNARRTGTLKRVLNVLTWNTKRNRWQTELAVRRNHVWMMKSVWSLWRRCLVVTQETRRGQERQAEQKGKKKILMDTFHRMHMIMVEKKRAKEEEEERKRLEILRLQQEEERRRVEEEKRKHAIAVIVNVWKVSQSIQKMKQMAEEQRYQRRRGQAATVVAAAWKGRCIRKSALGQQITLVREAVRAYRAEAATRIQALVRRWRVRVRTKRVRDRARLGLDDDDDDREFGPLDPSYYQFDHLSLPEFVDTGNSKTQHPSTLNTSTSTKGTTSAIASKHMATPIPPLPLTMRLPSSSTPSFPPRAVLKSSVDQLLRNGSATPVPHYPTKPFRSSITPNLPEDTPSSLSSARREAIASITNTSTSAFSSAGSTSIGTKSTMLTSGRVQSAGPSLAPLPHQMVDSHMSASTLAQRLRALGLNATVSASAASSTSSTSSSSSSSVDDTSSRHHSIHTSPSVPRLPSIRKCGDNSRGSLGEETSQIYRSDAWATPVPSAHKDASHDGKGAGYALSAGNDKVLDDNNDEDIDNDDNDDDDDGDDDVKFSGRYHDSSQFESKRGTTGRGGSEGSTVIANQWGIKDPKTLAALKKKQQKLAKMKKQKEERSMDPTQRLKRFQKTAFGLVPSVSTSTNHLSSSSIVTSAATTAEIYSIPSPKHAYQQDFSQVRGPRSQHGYTQSR